MINKEYQNFKLSMLGFGTMRLPLKGEALDSIDEEEVAKMFEYAIKKGINYFDTAWGYHNGKSEIVTGKTLKNYPNEEMEVILGIANDMLKGDTLPCTGCAYCTEYCPKGLNIPELISLYNEYTFTGGGFLAPMKISALPEEKRPTSCIGCQSCEAVCPQKIKIAEAMDKLKSIHIK